MKFLQVGLGSMGKRRIRCLYRMGYRDIIGFDPREDRRTEAEANYGIETTDNIEGIDFDRIDAMIISTPPHIHNEHIKIAIDNNVPSFVEASVVIGDLGSLAKAARKKHVLVAPSCTLRYHPAIKKIYDIVKSRNYGKLTNFTYHTGQYLPDWHPYEKVKDFYVCRKETGAAREIVPFELTWIVPLTGLPNKVTGLYGKTTNVGADIDDTYLVCMKFKKNIFGVLNVDVVSRYATRSLILNMEYAQILWRWDENVVKLYDARRKKWIDYAYSQGRAARGYNKNIAEDMYVNELRDFVRAAGNKGRFPNTLEEDIGVLKIVLQVEKGNGKK